MTESLLPNLRHLRIFEVTAQLESVNQASIASNLSQPAVTHAIKRLETFLGVALFERKPSGSYLTIMGKVLFARTQRLFNEIEKGLVEVGLHPSIVRAASSKITSQQLRAHITIVERRSFALAAQDIGITLSTLNASARKLELIVGSKLYHRTKGSRKATRIGAELARRLRLASREIECALNELSAAKGKTCDRISVGILTVSSTHLLPRLINSLLATYPDCRVQVCEGPYEGLVEDLRSGKIDFIFGVLHAPEWVNDIIEIPLMKRPYVIAVRKNHPLTTKSKITLEDLEHYEWVTTGPGTVRQTAFERLFSGRKLPRSSVETTSLATQRSLLVTSDRVSMMPRQDLDFEFGILQPLPLEIAAERPFDGITTRVDWQPTAVQKHFIQLFMDSSA